MKLLPIVARLEDQAPVFKQVGRVGGLLQAQGLLRISPAAFVYNTRETAEDNRYGTQITRQRVTERFAVAIGLKNVSDQHGGAAADDIDTLIETSKTVLIGWHHPDMEGVTQYVGGRAVPDRAGSQTAWWVSEFKATVHHQSS